MKTTTEGLNAKNKALTGQSLFFFISTLYVLTVLISSGDTYNYFIHDYSPLKWVNLALNVSIAAVLPLYLLGKMNDKLATGVVVYLTVVNIFYTNYFFLETNAQYWEQNYLRDIPILFVYMFAMCLTLSGRHLVLLNSVHILYCIGMAVKSDSEYIDENTIIIIASLLGFSIIMHTFLRQLKNSVQANIQMEQKIIAERENHLNNQLAMKDRELTYNALMMAKDSESSQQMIEALNKLKSTDQSSKNQEINRIIRSIKFSKKEDVWDEFQLRFKEVHPGFSENLTKKYPAITKSELKLASLLRLDLSSKKIAMLSGNTPESVDVSRSRLRKKMGLESNDSIVQALSKY